VTATDILAQARNAGLHLSAHGNRLRLRGRRPSTALLDDLVKHKAELLLVLGPAESTTTPLELIRAAVACWPDARRELWNERAAIIQHCGGETQEVAERRAYDCCRTDRDFNGGSAGTEAG